MPTMGLIACQILELELAYLLSRDPDIHEIIVIDDEYGRVLIKELKTQSRHTVIRVAEHGEYFPTDDHRLTVRIKIMEVGLHSVIKKLRKEVLVAAKQMSPYVDALFLGYGLCGNALEDPEELFAAERIETPVFIPMDTDHPVDDCIGLLIGGREKYYEEQCKVAGTMFMTPGFTRYWDTFIRRGNREGKLDWEISRLLFRHYERNLYLTTPVLPLQQMMDNTAEFNKHHGFRNEVRDGTLDMLEENWAAAKTALLTPLE